MRQAVTSPLKSYKFLDLANAPVATDEHLFADFLKSKDRQLLATLFRRHMALVLGVCKKYIAVKTAAQSATVEIFERLYNSEPRFEIKDFKSYLYLLSRDYCLTKNSGEKLGISEISEVDIENLTKIHPIDQQTIKDESIEKCLKELKSIEKQCVQLFYLKHKSYLEISQQLNLTIAAVKTHIQQGKQAITICIESRA